MVLFIILHVFSCWCCVCFHDQIGENRTQSTKAFVLLGGSAAQDESAEVTILQQKKQIVRQEMGLQTFWCSVPFLILFL